MSGLTLNTPNKLSTNQLRPRLHDSSISVVCTAGDGDLHCFFGPRLTQDRRPRLCLRVPTSTSMQSRCSGSPLSHRRYVGQRAGTLTSFALIFLHSRPPGRLRQRPIRMVDTFHRRNAGRGRIEPWLWPAAPENLARQHLLCPAPAWPAPMLARGGRSLT